MGRTGWGEDAARRASSTAIPKTLKGHWVRNKVRFLPLAVTAFLTIGWSRTPQTTLNVDWPDYCQGSLAGRLLRGLRRSWQSTVRGPRSCLRADTLQSRRLAWTLSYNPGSLPDPKGSRSNSHTYPRAASLALSKAAVTAQPPPPPCLLSAFAIISNIPAAHVPKKRLNFLTWTTLLADAILLPIMTPGWGSFRGAR